MSFLNLKSMSWMAVTLLAFLRDVSSERCRSYVTRSSVQHSWQSSRFKKDSQTYCFESRSTDNDGVNTFQYMHTNEGIPSTDAGFHWFVVKLKEAELIGSVNLKARNLANSEEISLGDRLNARAADIEIWTSHADLHFGSEHCSSRNISSYFEQAANGTWNLCGKTPTNVSSGDTLTVPCVRDQLVRVILLRKHVAIETDNVRQCMNFVNMWLELKTRNVTTELLTSKNNSIKEAKQNTSVTVRCNAECSADISSITITHEDRNGILAKGTLSHEISSVQPSDAGKYTCSDAGTVLSSKHLQVLYPPNEVFIAVDRSCSLNARDHVTFRFKSSVSEPTPKHDCHAYDSNGTKLIVLNNATDNVAGDKSLTSIWTCHNCCLIVGSPVLNLSCTAIQPATPWNSTIIESLVIPKFNKGDGAQGRGWNVDPSSLISIFMLTIVAVAIAIVAGMIFVWIRKKSAAQKPNEAVSKLADYYEALPLEPLQSKPEAPVSQLYAEGDDANNCTYVSLVPIANEEFSLHANVLQEPGVSSRPDSGLTEYIQIVADGL